MVIRQISKRLSKIFEREDIINKKKKKLFVMSNITLLKEN